MRVLVVNDFGFVHGGSAQVALESIKQLAEMGQKVTFVFGVGPVDRSVDKKKIRVVDLGLTEFLSDPNRLKASITGLWNGQAASRFGRLLEEFSPETTVIHFHSWTKALSSSVIKEAQKRNFKVVITLHDFFTACPNGGFFNHQTRQHCHLKPMTARCVVTNCDSRNYAYKLWRVARQFAQDRYANVPEHIQRFISVSEYSERLLKAYLPARARISRVANPIDIDQAPPASPAGHKAFTFVGRMSPEKGAVVFAKAAKQAGAESVFVGEGPEESAIRLVNPNARFKGWCNRRDVKRYVRESRAVIFPSLWHETLGLVVKEAAALGVPAIVSDSCAASESIEDGETGLLFRQGDVNDLSDKLALLDQNPRVAEEMGRAAYTRYWENPTRPSDHAARLIDVYSEALQR